MHRRFAELEAARASPLYERVAVALSKSEAALRAIATSPKRHPTVILAAEPREIHIVDWSREPFTSPRRPSERASLSTYGSPVIREPVGGRIHWAATETAASSPGHIEGAIRAGYDVARGITASIAGTPRC